MSREVSVVICTCGAWSKRIGAMVGVDLPIEPLRRQIAFTKPLTPRPPRVPFTIDYATTAYFHGDDDGSGLLLGIADPRERVGFDRSVTTDWHDVLRDALTGFAPSLADTEVAWGWAGFYEMTPDCNALIGEAETDGFRFLYAAGFSGHGFLQGPAVGESVRDLYLGRKPAVDVSVFDVKRCLAGCQRTELTSSDRAHIERSTHMTTAQTSVPSIPATEELAERARAALRRCGVDPDSLTGGTETITTRTPLTGESLFDVPAATAADVEAAIQAAHAAFLQWRAVPAPVRGGLIKRLGELLTEHKADLADLISVEVGKIRSEALGEVQEMIDICDFAVGLSRQLEGRTMPSERPGHRLMETWHPLGVVAVISAFNFPAAVWSWNTALALVCGDTVVWKPSEKTALVSIAASAILDRAARDVGAPENLNVLVLTDAAGAQPLLDSPLVPVVSATGSERMGAAIGPRVAARFGRTILELGGNNAAVITPSADLDLAVRGIVFAAAGTAGQRCTTMRRLIVHESLADEVVSRVAKVYRGLNVGNPFEESTLVGPLIDEQSFDAMQAALAQAVAEGGTVEVGGQRVETSGAGHYVRPAVVRMPAQSDVVRHETFAPILYVLTYSTFDEALELHNSVPQGLSSSIFTSDQREAERFLADDGSDCGIVNVNIGTSGAEIGGAFGGEKTTGGGRESGSDAWRGYMRRATNTVNYSRELPLAQGVSFA